jgi:hypothetical protein
MATKTARLRIKVIPGSSRTCIAGWQADVLRVRVSAPPEKGRANAAVEATVAKALGLSPRHARVVTGATSTRKTLEVTGLSADEIASRLKDG